VILLLVESDHPACSPVVTASTGWTKATGFQERKQEKWGWVMEKSLGRKVLFHKPQTEFAFLLPEVLKGTL
jgi:hypothetical protein